MEKTIKINGSKREMSKEFLDRFEFTVGKVELPKKALIEELSRMNSNTLAKLNEALFDKMNPDNSKLKIDIV